MLAARVRGGECLVLCPDAGFVAGFFGPEGVLEIDPAPVDDGHEQDEGCSGGLLAM